MQENKELYAWYRQHGICPQCGREKAAPGKARCFGCLEKNAESERNRRATESGEDAEARREKHRLYLARRREERKSAGLCIYCGKQQSKRSTCMCVDCMVKNQRRNDRRKDGIDRSERPAYGMCYICGAPITGGSLCGKCLERSMNNLPDKMNPELYRRHKQENRAIFRNG